MRLFSIFLSTLLTTTSVAQTQFIQNADFENWGMQPYQGLFGEDSIYTPISWYPAGALFPFALGQDDDFNMYQSSDAQLGFSCMELRPDTVYREADAIWIGAAGDQPWGLHGWYKMVGNPGDTLSALIGLLDTVPEVPNDLPHAFGEDFTVDTTSEWTEFEIELEYFNMDVPDSAIVSFNYHSTSDPVGYALIDNLSLIYPANVEESGRKLALTVYPNPASEVLNLRNDGRGRQTLILTNVHGQELKSVIVAPYQSMIMDVSDLPAGIYLISDAEFRNRSKKVMIN